MLIRSIDHPPRRPGADGPPSTEAVPARVRDLVVELTDPDATVADLAEALDPDRPAGPLLVDGRSVPAALPLDRAGLGDGATVVRAPPTGPTAAASAPPVVRLEVTAGFAAGAAFDLAPGSYRLGRGTSVSGAGLPLHPLHLGSGATIALDDPTVSAAHAQLHVGPDGSVRLTDLGSANGSTLDGRAVAPGEVLPLGRELRCGAARLVLGAPEPLPAPPFGSSAGPHPWHRTPRPAPAPPAPLIDPPAGLGTPPSGTPVGLVGVLASVLAGGVMVVALGSWTYGLFALLGPLLVAAGALDARLRRRRQRRRGSLRRRADVAALDAALAARQAQDLVARGRRYAGVLDAVRVATGPDLACWERRPHHADAFAVRIGVGPVPWAPPVLPGPEPWARDVAAVVAARGGHLEAPVGVVLEPTAPIALVGPPAATRSLARAILVQAACVHGPADLGIGVLAGPDAASAWDWTGWLPHGRDGEEGSLLAGSAGAAAAASEALLAAAGRVEAGGGPGRRWVVVIDDPVGLAARRSPARSVVRAASAGPVVPLVLVEDPGMVPAACSIVVEVRADGSVHGPSTLQSGPATIVGASEQLATDVARALARLDDPELDEPGRRFPAEIRLVDLLGPERCTPAGFTAQWRAGGADPAPRAVVGLAADGPLVVDLAADGPHALVAGTTGAGKSELLRTLVTALAAGSSPDHLSFVLIDFKGGTAFDACARLPHTAGLVTDLDDHLAARALRCLEAEIRHREARLRQAGADDLTDLRRREPTADPLPRLVVVVDEFATLAAELPDFVDALVGVAQRGRSLGLHLVLATQRPSGAVSEHIRANTALRVALRVHAAADSTDVIDVADAAALPRHRPGRALVRLGPNELIPFQAALASGPVREGRRAAVEVHPIGIRREAAAPVGGTPCSAPAAATGTPTELDQVVAAMSAAWAVAGGRPPRCPWPAPLGSDLPWPLDATAAEPDGLLIAWADDPDRQRQVAFEWRTSDGPLLAVGLPGSGTTTLAATVVLAAARRWPPHECHVHVIDLGAGGLTALAGLPHVGAVIGPDDDERPRRLLTELADEVARRRASPATATPRRILVVDGIGALRARWDDLDPSGTWLRFLEVLTQGTAVGVHVVIAAEGVGAAPHPVVSACRQRVVLRLGDRADHGAFGIAPASVPDLPPGRGVTADGRLVQVTRPPDGLDAAVRALNAARTEVGGPRPASVAVLPRRLPVADLLAGPIGSGVRADGTLSLPIGRSDVGLRDARLVLPPGGHALVAGPPRSGRSTTLATLAVTAEAAGIQVVVVARDPAPWARIGCAALDPAGVVPGDLRSASRPTLVLVDDADLTSEEHEVLSCLVTERTAHRHVVVAGRSDRFRSLYGHWSREVRADRAGLLLLPDPDLDGDLLGARLPRHPPVALGPGRGWLAGGTPEGFVQVAHPPSFATTAPEGADDR